MWLTRIYLIDKDFLIFYFYFESFDFLIWWYDLKRNIIWKAIKDNLSLKRISLLFYFILFLFYNKNHPPLLLKDQTQYNQKDNDWIYIKCIVLIPMMMMLGTMNSNLNSIFPAGHIDHEGSANISLANRSRCEFQNEIKTRVPSRQFFPQKFWVKSESTPVFLSKNLSLERKIATNLYSQQKYAFRTNMEFSRKCIYLQLKPI